MAATPRIIGASGRRTGARRATHPTGEDLGGIKSGVEIARGTEGRPFLTTSRPPLPGGRAVAEPQRSASTVTDAEGGSINGRAMGRGGGDGGSLLTSNVKTADHAINRGGRVRSHVRGPGGGSPAQRRRADHERPVAANEGGPRAARRKEPRSPAASRTARGQRGAPRTRKSTPRAGRMCHGAQVQGTAARAEERRRLSCRAVGAIN